ncbi:CEP44 [Branchiostoma lanceolatum]|uniref:Centrosomal protein of 44 kDa n=2 Tax=Branchiostoma lanceolatum TaxID=7740 RepID=A0A8K0EZ08_BRALA|nr:CEP44 [Branchiostoma lanceolatum]
MAATGDLKNNIHKLLSELKHIKYPMELDYQGITTGTTSAFLPVLHHALLEFSRPVSTEINDMGIELYGKTDQRFVEGVYKVLRDVFQYKPTITKDKFLNAGFAEHKVILAYDVLKMVQEKHRRITGPKAKPAPSQTNAGAGMFQRGTAMRRSLKQKNRERNLSPVQRSAADNTSLSGSPKETSMLYSAGSVEVIDLDNTGLLGPPKVVQAAPLMLDELPVMTEPVDLFAENPRGDPPRKKGGADTGYHSTETSPKEQGSLKQRVESLEGRMKMMEEKLETLIQTSYMKQEKVPTGSFNLTPEQVESILGRLLLVENRLRIVEAKNQTSSAGESSSKVVLPQGLPTDGCSILNNLNSPSSQPTKTLTFDPLDLSTKSPVASPPRKMTNDSQAGSTPSAHVAPFQFENKQTEEKMAKLEKMFEETMTMLKKTHEPTNDS